MSRRPFRVGRSRTGLGLFATKPISKGTIIVYYRGQKITAEESERREARGNRYLYEINSKWVVDGKSRSNVARYANHSCRPNCESDTRGHKIFVRAIKNIQPGDELTYHYGKNYFDIYLKPIGCKCLKCIEKRAKERAEKRAAAKRRKAREARKAEAEKTSPRKKAATAGNGVKGNGPKTTRLKTNGATKTGLKTSGVTKTGSRKAPTKTRAKSARKPSTRTAARA